MLDNPTWSDIYAPRGYSLVEGDYVKRIAYGQTLERIANEGADAFYTGDIAQSMVDTVQSLGGILSMEDVSVGTRYLKLLNPFSLQTTEWKVTPQSTRLIMDERSIRLQHLQVAVLCWDSSTSLNHSISLR